MVVEVQAADIIINTAETQTNGGQTLTSTGGDTITVTRDGAISTEGGTLGRPNRAIVAFTDRNTIENAGKINTKGEGADGIRTRSNNTISNSGSINTEGGQAEGIRAFDNNTITNEAGASIRTEGEDAEGIRMGDLRGQNEITNHGRITTSGDRAAGIYIFERGEDSKDNTVTNTGLITTTGASAPGIRVADKTKVNHSGRIQVSGPGSAGIRAFNGNELTLSGAITSAQGSALHLGDNNTINHSGNDTLRATGEDTPAVMMGDGNTLTNTGRIEATGRGANAHGITGGSNNKITHSGRIRVSGPGSAGILAGNRNELTLSGSITSAQGSALHLGDNNTINHSGNDTLRATGEDTPAVRLGDGNTLTNTGRIEATGRGANAHGITGGSNNIINNSGTISARGGKAICFTGRNNTINLLSGSVLIGGLCPGVNGRVFMTVDTAPAHSILWDNILARPKRGSGAPFFYNARTRQLATYDTRALAASAGALGDASGNVSGLMARPALRPSGNTRSLIPTATGSALWLRTFGNRARYRSRGNLNPEAGHLGLAAGYDLRLNATQFGLLAGYGRGELRFEGTQRFRPGPSLFKGPFAGLYVRRDFAPFSVQVGLAGGTLKHTSSRLVNDNRAPNGLARAEARTRSWWLAPEVRVGLRLDAGLMQFEPSFTARYTRQSIRGFSETGIRAPATVGQRKVELLETRLELKTIREVGPGRIALKAGWQYRDDLKSNEAQVRMLGESQRVRLESGLGSSLYLGAEAKFELAPGLFLNLSGEAVSGDGYRNMSGMASVYQAF